MNQGNKFYGLRIIIAFILTLIAGILFSHLAISVKNGATLVFDSQILLEIHRHATPFLNKIVPIVTNIGGLVGVTLAVAAAMIFFATKRYWKQLIIVTSGVIGATLLNIILKFIFERQRPDLWQQLVVENSFSFPSGHAMASAALAFSLVAAFWYAKEWRMFNIIIAIIYIIFVGMTRLYLGVHYPSDILAGWLMSGIWVAMVVIILDEKVGDYFSKKLFKK